MVVGFAPGLRGLPRSALIEASSSLATLDRSRYHGEMSSPNVVAVINTSTDVTDMLRTAFEFGGFITVTALTTQIRDGEIDVTPRTG